MLDDIATRLEEIAESLRLAGGITLRQEYSHLRSRYIWIVTDTEGEINCDSLEDAIGTLREAATELGFS